jgi:hypothetical protein
MLAVAGVERPDYFHGRVLLGEEQEAEPKYLFHARDRMDERYDMIRSARDSRYQYIRNFESHKPWVAWQRTPSRGAIYQELYRIRDEGLTDQFTAPFLAETKPVEELYDTLVDPWEMHNLASDPAYGAKLRELRSELLRWMKEMDDKGLVPEPELLRTTYPHNKREQVEPPSMSREGGRVALNSDVSIAYTLEAGEDAHWLVYTEPVALAEGETLRAKAVRLGYEDSVEVTAR